MSEQQPVEGEVIDHTNNGLRVLEQLSRAEIDTQIRTAKEFPRDIKKFIRECSSLACMSPDIAEQCMYALKRGGKTIEGPSARLAEIVVSTWGNCQAGARVIEEGAEFVVAQGVFRDLERNTAITYEVRRRITNKHGNRYDADMIGVTANAACSIALRNAVFKGVPKAFWNGIYEQARQTAIGDVKDLPTRRAAMIGHFGKMGVTPEQIVALLGIASVEQIGMDDLATLKGIATSLKDGETTIEETFKTAAAASPEPGRHEFAGGFKKEPAEEKAEPSEPATQTDDAAVAAAKEAIEQKRVEAGTAAPGDGLKLTKHAADRMDQLVQMCRKKTKMAPDIAKKAVLTFLGQQSLEPAELESLTKWHELHPIAEKLDEAAWRAF